MEELQNAESEAAGADAAVEAEEAEAKGEAEVGIEWYYQEPTTGQPAGPWTVAQLRARWQRDEINGLTPVWHVGRESWTPIAELPELKDALRQAVADEERPPKRRRTLDEVPLIHTYTSEQGELFVYDTVDEDWKASDIYEALLKEEDGEKSIPEVPVAPATGSEGMTPEEQDAALRELFEEASRGGPLGAGPTMDPRRQVATDLAVERAAGEVRAEVAKAKAKAAAQVAQAESGDQQVAPDKEAKRQKRREYRERKKLKQQAGLFIKAKENPNVYVSGLPPDTTVQELDPLFKRAGVLKLDVETCSSKIRVYTGPDGRCKGDALVTFANAASVELAVKFLHEYEIRPGCRICVQQADFEEEKKDAKLSKDELKELAAARKPEDQRAKYLAAKNSLKEAVSWSGEMDDGTGRRIVLLRHMFSPEDAEKGGPSFYEELIEEVKQECEKIGQVMRVTPIERHVQGIVCIKFKLSSEAEECIRVMDGRFFDGRTLEASFYDGKTDLKAFGVQDSPKKKRAAGSTEASQPTVEETEGEQGDAEAEVPAETDAVEAPEIQQAYDAMFDDQSSDDEDLVVRTE